MKFIGFRKKIKYQGGTVMMSFHFKPEDSNKVRIKYLQGKKLPEGINYPETMDGLTYEEAYKVFEQLQKKHYNLTQK